MRRFDKHIPIEKIIKRRRTADDFKRFWRPGVLSLLADAGYVPQVNHQRRAPALPVDCLPCGPQLRDPRGYQLAFKNQPAFCATIDDRNLQHAVSLRVSREGKSHAKLWAP